MQSPWCKAKSGSTGSVEGSGGREALVQSQVRFNRVPEKVPALGLGGFDAEPSQVQQGSGEGSGEGSRKPWCKAKSGSTGSVEGSGEGLGGFGAALFRRRFWRRSGSTGFRRRFRRRSGRLWSRLRCFQRLGSQHASERL